MYKFLRTFIFLLCARGVFLQRYGNDAEGYKNEAPPTEHPGGVILGDKVVFTKANSPYRLTNDLIIERDAELLIEAGVQIRIQPQIGITVRGVFTAVGTENERITLTTAETTNQLKNLPDIRLVDGPSILAGRVQIKHKKQWRSICTNSRNWTVADMETACRQLGFQGGSFFSWFNRQMPIKSRLLYEEPRCTGTEGSLVNCDWKSRQMGSGVCDYHPDLGLQCLPRHDRPMPFWRGLRFEYAKYEKVLTESNTLYVPISNSKLEYVQVMYAGAGRDQNTTSALHVIGVPPKIDSVEILNSAYNGINITSFEAPVTINNCTVRNNRGYGIFINSSYGLTHINDCVVNENGGDGIRFVKSEERPDERLDKLGYTDFCNLATTLWSPTFPLQIYAEQTIFRNGDLVCDKVFTTRFDKVITIHIIRAVTDKNETATLEIYDGSMQNHRLMLGFPIRNNTRPQSLTSTGNQIYIKFKAEPRTNLVVFMRLMSGNDKSYDLNVSNSDISENLGRGIAVDNLRSQVHIYKSSVSKNQHVAGIHVSSGVGDVNITNSKISFNEGDGINVTYTGGSRNISYSTISSNKGYGLAVWLNQSQETEYIFANQTSVLQYSEIFKNLETGVLHGNFCGPSLFNFTANKFRSCISDALEIMSCWVETNESTRLQIGHNVFVGNTRIGLRISPAVNLQAKIEFNHFKQGTFGALLIKNKPLEQFNELPSYIVVQQNYFRNNTGIFVANLALSPYSQVQRLLFTRNFVQNNKISEPFQPEDGSPSMLIPRSRVAAPVVIGSNNIDVFRNIIENLDSRYEIGSHLEDQSKTINCTYNWLGSERDETIFGRLFHRYDRYTLARISFTPYLLHNSNPLTRRYGVLQTFVPKFYIPYSNKVGGEIEGEEILTRGEYMVERDISIRPGGKLTLEPGVTLRFPPSIGIMIGGQLDARGISPDSIKLTLKEEITHPPDNETFNIVTEISDIATELVPLEPVGPIRLLGGNTETVGRLQVKINNEWGTVCNYGWTQENAAIVCQQLGFVLNPNDWKMERNEIPAGGTTEPVVLANIQCDAFDMDITKCRRETVEDFENTCTHENDVGIKCYKTSWAGVRFAGIAERSNVQYLTIEKSGLLDYATSKFKPALQLDFSRHNFENLRVSDNYYDGLGVLYSDIYTDDTINMIRNSEFSRNKGAGLSFKQLGFNIYNSMIEDNDIGIKHDSSLSGLEQREFAGWFKNQDESSTYQPISIPNYLNSQIELQNGETKYLVTQKVEGIVISKSYKIRCEPGWVVGIQLLNPIENRSTEDIIIHDSLTYNDKSDVWIIKRDLTVFPTTSTSHGVILDYNSGSNSIGNTVIVISAIRAPFQNIYNRIVKGPVPTLTITKTKIRNNNVGLKALYYNRYLNELGDHFLRKANESLKFINCDISHNRYRAFFIESPHWDLHSSNISEITIMINNSLITDNGQGVYHFSRDMRQSNNLFHYVLQDDTIERNQNDGFNINLPYVWQYNENFTHSVYMDNNTWNDNRNFALRIDGHFALINITRSRFNNNVCKTGLLSIKGMEKKMLLVENKFNNNNGRYVVSFSLNSQSEIVGNVPAIFMYNELKDNRYSLEAYRNYGYLKNYQTPTCAVGFNGIQKVRVRRNLFSNNALDYLLIAGIKTAKINNTLNVAENWWDSNNEILIKSKIFDFDDWNDHAVAQFRPYLMSNDFESSTSVSYPSNEIIDLDRLGGQINENVVITSRSIPYVIKSDITIMPKVVLTIDPGVIMEFPPNVGILVLGTLKAQGYKRNEIIMRPFSTKEDLKSLSDISYIRKKRQTERMSVESVRLCKRRDCGEVGEQRTPHEGFLEYFNKTTYQWIPMCDTRFTERNAQVVCRQLGYDPLNAFIDHDVRIDFHSNSLTRIWSWPEPLQCDGSENNYEECPIRLNGQQYGYWHRCEWNSKFVFINCGTSRNQDTKSYWGGIRFADPDFEEQLFVHRLHDANTHTELKEEDSIVEYVKIIGAGMLHNEKSPALQSIKKSPKISHVTIQNTSSHGINFISPSKSVNLLYNTIENSLGAGINILSLTGEGKESDKSSFMPLRALNIPYNLFSMVDICDTHKEITIEERILIYYKYDNHPVNCIKIFRSAFGIKRLGFRALQFNLFNSTNEFTIPDFISLYDGDIYNVSSKVIAHLTMKNRKEDTLYKTNLPSLSVKLFANGASYYHGFIAEIVTLPISAIGFNRDVQHNISNSEMRDNREGGIVYMTVGEVNPILTIEKNQIRDNCKKLYGNFTTCKAAIEMDVQNTESLFFRNNLVANNQGGLSIKADSSGSATSLKGFIHNNLFVNNTNLPALYIEGRQSSPYQEVTLTRNYFTRNYALYSNNIVLKQVVSKFTHNYVKRNVGLQNLEISGFDRVRLPIFQTTSHNGFYNNFAVFRDSRSTIVAGTAGQQYVHNIFFNPDNDYDIITVNRSLFEFNSTLQLWNTKIDAISNYWGVNTTLAVSGRIRDQRDDPRLLEVQFEPYLMNNKSILNDIKCPPGWNLVGETCYMYIGAPMTFYEAKAFCQADNSSMPYLLGNINYVPVYQFLKKQHLWYLYTEKVWVQHIDYISQCTMFVYQSIEVADCEEKHPFICEIDPKVTIRILPVADDLITISVISTACVAILLILIVAACWWSKSKYRHAQRLERRNSIRASIHSLRSVGLTPGSFSDASYRRKMGQLSTRSTDTLTKYTYNKKMITNGSVDSMEKSGYNSSEENRSLDDFNHNPNPSAFAYNPTIEYHKSPSKFESQIATPQQHTLDLGFKNDGFRDNSTFASTSNFQSGTQSVDEGSVNDDETPIILPESSNKNISYPPSDYYESDTLPLNRNYDRPGTETSEVSGSYYYDPGSSRARPNVNLLQELKTRLPQNGRKASPETPEVYSPTYSEKLEDINFSPDFNTVGLAEYQRPKSANILETDFDNLEPKSRAHRAKSEVLLETNFDYTPEQSPILNHPISDFNRSKSQPLETSM